MAKYLDLSGLTTYHNKAKAAFVAKETGKGLSTNDYTDSDKTKLAGIATGAEVNILEGVKVNGAAQTITDKVVDITVPTKVSDLTNDSGYQTESQVTSAITTAISGVTSFDYEKVDSLPETGTKGVIYLIANSGKGKNIYDEYLWIGDKFELFGTKELDLSDYAKTADVNTTLQSYALKTDLNDYIKTADLESITTSEINSLFE